MSVDVAIDCCGVVCWSGWLDIDLRVFLWVGVGLLVFVRSYSARGDWWGLYASNLDFLFLL